MWNADDIPPQGPPTGYRMKCETVLYRIGTHSGTEYRCQLIPVWDDKQADGSQTKLD